MILQKYFNAVRESMARGEDLDIAPLILRYTSVSFRPYWMTDTQWSQYVAFCRGDAVPTDPELILGLRRSPAASKHMHKWVYTSVSSAVAGSNYSEWCQCIDNSFDIGL